MTTRKFAIKVLLAGAILTLAASLPAIAAVVDVNGYKFDDMTKVAGKDLKLNGAGMRTKFIVKVYAAGLYLPEKKNNTAEILKEEGPRRVTLQMARDMESSAKLRLLMTVLSVCAFRSLSTIANKAPSAITITTVKMPVDTSTSMSVNPLGRIL